MKVTIKIVDSRRAPGQGLGLPSKYEEYDRLDILEAELSPNVAAGFLRAVAYDLDGELFIPAPASEVQA